MFGDSFYIKEEIDEEFGRKRQKVSITNDENEISIKEEEEIEIKEENNLFEDEYENSPCTILGLNKEHDVEYTNTDLSGKTSAGAKAGRKATSRTQYSTQKQRDLLIELVCERKRIVCDKSHDHKITRKKKEIWKEITDLFNAAAVGDKMTEKQVRKMWERLKGRKKHAMKKKELLKTGGGVPAEDVDDKTAKVYDIIYDELKDLDNVFDSDPLTDDTRIHVSSVSAAEDLEDLRPSSSNSSRQSPLQTDVEQKGKKEWKFSPAAECYEQSLKMHEREHEMDMKIKEAQLESAQEFIVACKSIKYFVESATQAIKEAAVAVPEAAKTVSRK
ncbi:uncharacterized protein LOC119573204 [Penaeus monodon]|uniref:uncharacterized protein LOC119573204 n=1 Tax=Penaeus monodon TaxID=6687 RepID=UPI0018A70529|nr:uncharacterized protein LOC119573204 [Penaeus monodon]